jgi:hypothetical protein
MPDQSGNGPHYADDQSLFKAGQGLKAAPEKFNEFARELAAWARQLREDQPMAEAVPDQIEAAVQVIKALGADSEAWHATYRHGNAVDIDRAETPRRGSHAVEAKADVTAYRRDM